MSSSKHIILFLAANPLGTSELALGREARAIQEELERSGQRDRFEFVTRWAVQPLDLIRELRKLKPTVVHFSGHGGSGGRQRNAGSRRDIAAGVGGGDAANDHDHQSGLFFQGLDGRRQLVTTSALRETFGAAGASVKLVVLNACYSGIQAEALLVHVDCVVGVSGSLRNDAARAFAIGFYGGLGERQSVAAAYLQGCAAISLDGRRDDERPQLRVRDNADADQVVLAATSSIVRERPIPVYPGPEVEQLSKRLEEARERRDKLRGAGVAAEQVDCEILELRRQLREGGRLRAGDALGDGRYLLVRIVGRGGFAVVWEAHDCATQQRVAVKVLHSNLAGDPLRRERFFRGAHAMMGLVHPAVVRVLEPIQEDGGYYYFVMEFVPGGNLRDAVITQRVKMEDLLPLIIGVGEVLTLAHARGMIHRDVKPANILLDEHGNAKLTDFDLVGAQDTTGGTRTGALGTIVYAAPECLERPQEATPRADVYGLGMTAIFCLSGRDLPIDTFRNPERTISKLDCSIRIQDVLRRAVAWHPDERFADATAMVIELRNALNYPDRGEVASALSDEVSAEARRADLPALVPTLTIVSHPLSHRVGERCRLEALALGGEVNLSRNAPDFTRPGGAMGGPLGDPFVSRRPIRFAPTADGGVGVFVDPGGTPVCAGSRIDGNAAFTCNELTHGVLLKLAERVVLLLHMDDGTVKDAADPLGMVGTSVGIRRVRIAIERLADLAVPVLVRGETGTGKELVARTIHDRSPYRAGPFISVNLAALPRDLVAADLFGWTRGAFSNAARDRGGLFWEARGGTLFLDEVGEASPEVQVMLLRVLETDEIHPLGGAKPIAAQVRLIAATDTDLEKQIHQGKLKAPLLHRFGGYEIPLPPLRDRREDIGSLFYHFAHKELTAIGEGHQLSPQDHHAPPWLPAALAAQLVRYSWPDNVRELRNVTRQLVIESRGLPQLRLESRLADQLGVVAPSRSTPPLRSSDGANLAALGPPTRTSPRPDASARSVEANGSEQRLLAVVMLGPAVRDDEQIDDALRRAVVPYAGRLEQLADGSTVVMLDADRQVATDQAARAARCALTMSAIATDRPLAIAMGRTESGSRLPKEDVINQASRLLAHMAERPDELPPVALDEVSAGLLDARFDVVEHESQLRLRGERAVMQGARTLLGRPTPCVGRDWELGALAGILAEVIEESAARVAVVTAAAGMGKSRLGAEFVGRIRERYPEVAIWVGRGDSLRAGSTLDLLAQALRDALRIHEGEPLAERVHRIRARVAEHIAPRDQRRVAAFLGELAGAPFPTSDDDDALRAARQDAQLMSDQMRRTWLDFLRAETTAHPVLVVLDDLHWGDFGTVRFIDAALRERGELPWMVLALARPEVFEVFPRLWDRPSVQAIRLEALGRKASERLIRQVLGDRASSETVERLARQADGNAFYLEELIRMAAEGKGAALPQTVLAMVETRLARLPFEARRVLRAASVFGEVCWEDGAIALLDGLMPAPVVAEWVSWLAEHEMLVARPDSRFPGERELAFRHALLREGAYATLTDDDRGLGHRRAGDWLERHGESNPMVLAGHFERGGDGARAARHYLRAAQQAVQVLDPQAAMARAALGLASAPSPELRMALLGVRCEAGQAAHQIEMEEAEELLRLATPGSVPWAQGLFAYNAGLTLVGRIQERLASIPQLHDITPAPGAAGWVALMFSSSIFFVDLIGQVAQGTALEASFEKFVRAHGNQEPLVRMWWSAARSVRFAHAHDDPWTGLQYSIEMQSIHDAIGGELTYVLLMLLRAKNQWYLGALAPAVQTLEAVPAADTAVGVVGSVRRFALSWLYSDLGQFVPARALAAQLVESGRTHKNQHEEARGCWALAEALCRDGDLAGADRELEVALAIAVPLEQPGVRATLSAVRLAQGRAGEALVAAEDAMARYTAMGGCGLFRGAFVRLTHAEALHAAGAHDAARRAIADARARLFAIANTILDPSYKASFLENVPENARTLTLAHAWLGDGAPSA